VAYIAGMGRMKSPGFHSGENGPDVLVGEKQGWETRKKKVLFRFGE